ncbi:hypothetical protein IQ06DRAFT_297423 [Phaeosphaeriaceae sp. SRC1lsM3a]|nr:hypothetical protein IQ06DRAFT_297423 [Stagonospora sp. SRC1lsM3a]
MPPQHDQRDAAQPSPHSQQLHSNERSSNLHNSILHLRTPQALHHPSRARCAPISMSTTASPPLRCPHAISPPQPQVRDPHVNSARTSFRIFHTLTPALQYPRRT